MGHSFLCLSLCLGREGFGVLTMRLMSKRVISDSSVVLSQTSPARLMSWSGKTKSPSRRPFPAALLLTEEPLHPSGEIRESSWPQAYYSAAVSYRVDITLVQADVITCERKMAGENQQSTQHLSRLPGSKCLQRVPTCDALFGLRRYRYICAALLFCGRKSRYLIRLLVKSPHYFPF